MNTTNKALTVKDVASYLNVDEKTIYRLVSKGSIPGFKVSGSWRFQLQDIQGWIDEQKRRTRTKERAKG
jgi:excisionase family DNA binding protein